MAETFELLWQAWTVSCIITLDEVVAFLNILTELQGAFGGDTQLNSSLLVSPWLHIASCPNSLPSKLYHRHPERHRWKRFLGNDLGTLMGD